MKFGAQLSIGEEDELALAARDGDSSAAEKLVLSLVPLVKTIANKYYGLGMEFDDLLSEGIYGVVKAIQKFDPIRGMRFVAFAGVYAKYSICNAITRKASMVRVPGYLGRSERTISFSIHDPVRDTEFRWIDIIPDERAAIPGGEERLREDRYQELRELLESNLTLTPRERSILKGLFGIGTKQETQRAVAERLNLTQERVRQLYQRGLERLRRKLKATL